MIKILRLLHEGTIVDVRLLCQLSTRYKIHFIFAVIFFGLFFSYNYYSQPIIYSISTPIKVVTSHRVSTDLSALLPTESINLVTLDELHISFANFSFLKDLASLITQNPNFDTMNFGNIQSRSLLLGRDLKRSCSNKNCLLERLAPLLNDLFYVEQGLSEGRFKIVTNAIDKKTTLEIASALVKAVELERIKIRQYTVLKEIKSVGSLIDESRSVMQTMGGFKALEEQEKLLNNILDLKERIRMLQYNSSLEIANSSSLQAQVTENRRSTRNAGSSAGNYESYLKFQNRLNDIKTNINNLTRLPEEKRTLSDKLIISQLFSERTQLLKELPADRHFKTMEQGENFKEKQIENTDNFKFNYLVSKNKIARLKADYETSKVELNELLGRKLINESKVNGMKVDLDFLKSLESKQMSLKLINATMTSDLIFEDTNQQIEDFRRSSSEKILVFSFAMTAFLYILSILLRYLADDTIYGEEEIRLYFKNLDFVGDVPSFE